MAQAIDNSMDITEDGGRNLESNVVQLVRRQWNSFDHDTTGGHFLATPRWADIQEGIDSDRIFVVGDASHYFVVIGYSDEGGTKELLVLDPWPAGKGGERSVLSFNDLMAIEGRACIRFGDTR